MNPDELDQAVTVTLATRAETVRPVRDPLPGVTARAHRLHRNRLLLTTLPVIAGAAIAGSVALAVGLGSDNTTAPTPSTDTSTNASTATSAPTSTPTTAQPPATRDEALRQQLTTNHTVAKTLLGRAPTGHLLCAINVEGADPTSTHFYTWIMCGDYTTGPDATQTAGGAEPAVVTVTGHGTQVRITHIAFPRQAHLQADINQMFPADIAPLMTTGNIAALPTAAQLLEQARNMS